MTEQTTTRTERAKATWTVFEVYTGVGVIAGSKEAGGAFLAEDATALVEIDTNVVARTGADACWTIAETELKDRATSDNPPVLTASRNGTSHGLTEARPYPLKTTVERIK